MRVEKDGLYGRVDRRYMHVRILHRRVLNGEIDFEATRKVEAEVEVEDEVEDRRGTLPLEDRLWLDPIGKHVS